MSVLNVIAKSTLTFFIGLGAAIAYLIIFSLFVAFASQYGLNAGMGAVIFACIVTFILPIYFSKRNKSLNERQNISNFSKDIVKGTVEATKTTYQVAKFLLISLGVIVGILIAVGAFIYLASLIGRLGSAGIIIILLVLIFFKLQEINNKL